MKPVVDPLSAAEKYPHGTRARYTLGKCRCFECKVANSDYAMELAEERRLPYTMHYARAAKHYVVRCRATGVIIFRDRMNKREAPDADRALVDTAKVRRHIESLRKQGMGTREIAHRSGISRSVLVRIISGEIRRTRTETAQAILGVTSTAAGGARVSAEHTWHMLDVLIRAGYRKGAIARMLGAKTRALQISREVVVRSTEITVEKLYAALWLKDERVRAIAPQPPSSVELPTHQPADIARRKLRAMSLDAFAAGLERLLAS